MDAAETTPLLRLPLLLPLPPLSPSPFLFVGNMNQ
jgi:hypothetical protein